MKILEGRSRRYFAGRTLDLSAGGALLEVRGGAGLPVGADLEIAITPRDREDDEIDAEATPVLRRHAMRTARIVRVDPLPESGGARIAVRYTTAQGVQVGTPDRRTAAA